MFVGFHSAGSAPISLASRARRVPWDSSVFYGLLFFFFFRFCCCSLFLLRSPEGQIT